MVKKFAVFSGFLGSGKTSAMMALTRYYNGHHGKSAMISNDLGGAGLADHRLARLEGCRASELTGKCICYQTEHLAARLRQLFGEEGCQLVVCDIPGFGVGALEHVYHTLAQDYPTEFPLAPFTVLVEPRTVELLQNGGGDLGYILRTQLLEADLIVLNKCDILTDEMKKAQLSWLEQTYQSASVLGISARTGEGLAALAGALRTGRASLRRPDIGYGGAAFSRAMGKMSEYNIQYYVTVCCNDFDGNAYLLDLARFIQQQATGEIPHLKLLAWEPEGDYGKVDLLGLDRPVEISKRFGVPCTDLAVVLNASAACDRKVLDSLMTEAVDKISDQYQLLVMVYRKECFGVMEER